jgi:cohesin complex subunit SA-1/2
LVEKEKDSLFSIVRSEGTAISVIVEEYIKRYETDPKSSLSELITFVLNSSGSLAELKSEDIKEDVDFSAYLENFIKHFPKNSNDYPIISKHSSLKNFSRNYLEFWSSLLKGISESILFDEVFFKNILGWLSLLSNSLVRSFRHTSTLTLYMMIDNLIEISSDYQKKMSKIESQIKTAKSSKNKKQEKELSTTNKELNKKLEEIQSSITEIYDDIFSKRYRDSLNHIRALSIESLGGWIILNPDNFLTDNHLKVNLKLKKYFGWTLYDRDAGVRNSLLSVLMKIYSKERFHGQLQRFTNKYLNRFFELSEDIDISVASKSIELLVRLLNNDFINEDDSSEKINNILALIFDENQKVRVVAGDFAFYYLSENIKIKKKNKLDLKMDSLLSFMKDNSENQNLALYVVEAFWDHSDLIKNYEEIIEWITDSEELSDEDQLNLLKLLNSSIKKLIAMGGTKKKTKKKDDEDEEDEISKMTSYVSTSLPQILTKFQSDKEKIEELLEIPQYLKLSVYVSNNNQHVHLI